MVLAAKPKTFVKIETAFILILRFPVGFGGSGGISQAK